MKKIFICASVLSMLGVGQVSAQDIYKVEQVSTTELDGDARFVGMGGAMGALGANLSAMSTNPASSGLYRRSDMSFSAGFVAQPYDGTQKVGSGNRTAGSFDQAGLLYACNLGNASGVKFVNFGFNYRKGRNLKNYIGLNNVRLPKVMEGGVPMGMSQSWQFVDLASDLSGNLLDLGFDNDRERTTPSALLAYDTYLIDAVDADGLSVGDRDVKIDHYVPSYANRYNYNRAQWGGVHDFDFNLSLNLNERVYLGVNLGVYNVNMHSAMSYDEELYQNGDVNNTGNYNMYTEESVTGSGVDGKFGLIVRPMEENPLRLGISVTTPTVFDLESRSYAEMTTPYESYDDKGNYYDTSFANVDLTNSYRIRTPWKLDLSAATTFGTRFAVDAEYQLQCKRSAAVRYAPNNDYYWEDNSYSTDTYLAEEISNYMKNVHTFRLGAEARVNEMFSVRAGYNFVSSPFEKEAFLNLFTDGSSYYYATNTDYVNLGSTNRVTLGAGLTKKFFYFDVAYMHQMQNADVYAFHYNLDKVTGVENDLPGQRITLHRNQFLMTMGFRF